MTLDGAPRGVPLCVDLDGTLLKTDLLYESLLLLVCEAPWRALLLPGWLAGGKAAFKRRVAASVTLDPGALPHREEVVEWLRAEKAAGRRIVLATASDGALARALSDHLGLFDEVVASDGGTNVSGVRKRDLLVSRFGEKGFDYSGNSVADLPVWEAARKAIVVAASPGVLREARRRAQVDRVFPGSSPSLGTVLEAIRVRQWVKSLLVFVPVLTALRIGEAEPLSAALVAFLALSLCASAIYVVNDLADLPSDRRHREKRRRPFASGALSIATGALLPPLLLAVAAAVALLLPVPARVLLLAYVVCSTLYTFSLKKRLLVDVFALALLYTLRVLLGGAATGILVSPWLLAFSIFVFLSLAFVKRASELFNLKALNREGAPGRDWGIGDHRTVTALGVASAQLAGLVLAIYISSDHVRKLYRHPGWLWLLVPLFLYWTSRLWVLAGRGAMDEDPILFATRDKVTIGIALVTIAILVAAARLPFPPPGLME